MKKHVKYKYLSIGNSNMHKNKFVSNKQLLWELADNNINKLSITYNKL